MGHHDERVPISIEGKKSEKRSDNRVAQEQSEKLVRKNFHPAISEDVTRANTTSREVSLQLPPARSIASMLEQHVRIFPTHRGSALSKRGRYISPSIRRLDAGRRKRESHRKLSPLTSPFPVSFSRSPSPSRFHPPPPALSLILFFFLSLSFSLRRYGNSPDFRRFDIAYGSFPGAGQRSFHWLPTGSRVRSSNPRREA